MSFSSIATREPLLSSHDFKLISLYAILFPLFVILSFSEYQKNVFLNYIEEKVLELAKNEGIQIFSVPFDEMNKNEVDEDSKAVGKFIYYKDKQVTTYYETTFPTRYGNLTKNDLPREKVLPRIEISDQGDVYTILHELGHYFIYKRDQIQSEAGANMFIEEFFENYLPPFFKWIYQIEIKIRTKKNI